MHSRHACMGTWVGGGVVLSHPQPQSSCMHTTEPFHATHTHTHAPAAVSCGSRSAGSLHYSQRLGAPLKKSWARSSWLSSVSLNDALGLSAGGANAASGESRYIDRCVFWFMPLGQTSRRL
jgi:hypothetical protein